MNTILNTLSFSLAGLLLGVGFMAGMLQHNELAVMCMMASAAGFSFPLFLEKSV